MANSPLILGLDGGGTKCKAVIYSTEEGKIIGEGTAGPGNPVHGVEVAQESIITSTEVALADAGLPAEKMSELVAGAGLAGVNLPKYMDIMTSWKHPFAEFFVTTDLHIACYGSHNSLNGAAIITGTGSCGVAVVDGETHMVGGHGFGLGDKGAGAWTGLKAVQHVLEVLDGLAEPTELTDTIQEQLGVVGPYPIIELMTKAPSAAFGRFSPLVHQAADRGDKVAIEILKEGGDYISKLARKLMSYNPGRLSMLGGLAPLIINWMDEDIASQVSPALGQPEDGAVFFAKEMIKQKA
ncbi:ATPase [Catenovulum sp. SM1970]|uniref:N-acetylglucosamine kinase n=1 Tax=Marinifaba aquimaris TaxID=2741323 RepID=UPI001574851D|nr:BadF/BadG/BcrA/BcrD ATPase family protein [Marinifaba aquimaris]NTS76614.1 ATPase [Marinifaba aquimaris]